MRDRSPRKINVLGIDVSVMRVDKAVNISMELLRSKGVCVICFLSAVASLLCQNEEEAAEYVRSCQLILPGDQHIEMAARNQHETGKTMEGIGEFADNYLKRLLSRLNRDRCSIYAITGQPERLTSMEEYIRDSYKNIQFQGGVLLKETKGEADRVVNEINACIPDIVFVCLPAEHQIKFMEKHAAMMNTRLCILIESIQPLIRKETEEIPSWIEALHLSGIYHWFKGEEKIRNTIAGSLFKKKVKNEVIEQDSETEKQDSEKE
ncbi:MAG: WecB/TagA/CpsF family glycosyltransferase [Eubacterium sp.]|nr:WecB/TagA/CpsF family glycosyltransferase [Eubacterium sp.]MDD7209550.1 WecB/TagA/CpsF family glycosyltransferase [Lachnospiraceae bacterium]MDY5498434.1 WecB/TagA/CpsF family glycosyltransferase [Anaerobutyricum sp.]